MATAAAIMPVFVVRYIPMIDLPAHLARLQIIWHYAENPEFHRRYELLLKPIPYIALDMFTPLLAWISMPGIARLFVTLTVLVFAVGCAMMSRSLYGSITPLAVLAVFVTYNSTFLYGFVEFQLSVALFLIALALWLRWRDRWTIARLCALSAVTIAVYLAHIGGYFFLTLSVAWLTAFRWWQPRRIEWKSLAGWIPLLFPVCLHLLVPRPLGDINTISWTTIGVKLRHGLALLAGFDGRVDASVALALLAAIAIAFRYGRIRIHPEIGSLAALFCLLFAISPYRFLTGADADTRFLAGAGVLALLALRVEISEGPGRAAFLLALFAFLFRIAFIGWVWTAQDRMLAENIAVFDQAPRNARIYPIFKVDSAAFGPVLNTAKFEQPLVHAISWATVDRDAIVPTNFTVKGQHIVIERDGYWFQQYDPETPPQSFDWTPVFHNYDVIWYYGSDSGIVQFLEARCSLIARKGKSRLYRITKPT